ncbi:MAG: hypothetical protein Q8O37_12860 [Sulfuricellaceae bacterium]|nr:hypothetical protein [Sulfuricellaceae bacterium]
MPDVKTKVCLSCKQEKPISAFYLKQRDDVVHECLECRIASASGDTSNSPPNQSAQSAKNMDKNSKENVRGRIPNTLPIRTELALLELTLLNAESSDQDFYDFVQEGQQQHGIPLEILTRMKGLWEQTKMVAGEVIAVGKIIIMKIIEFFKAHPELVASLAIGAAVYLLSHAIPIIGPLLAPLLAAVTAIYAFGTQVTFDEAIGAAKDFFALIVGIFNAVAMRWSSAT